MDTQESSRTQLPEGLRFRVLIIGRANAGKTSILQRVCETTESPTVYRELAVQDASEEARGDFKREKVRGPTFLFACPISLLARSRLTRPSMLVTTMALPLRRRL